MHAVLDKVVTQIASEISSLDAETSQWHPGGLAHEWSAQQVVEHLVLGFRQTSRAMESRLKKGLPSSRWQRTYLQWSLQWMILFFGKLPRGAPALKETIPVPDKFPAMGGRELGEFLRQETEAMDETLDRCRRKFGMEPVALHPLLGPLRVDQWRRFHVVHSLHHVAQIRSVIASVTPTLVPIRVTAGKLPKKLTVPVQRPLA